MDLDEMTTVEVEALLHLLTDMEREELEVIMQERRGQSGRGSCIVYLLLKGKQPSWCHVLFLTSISEGPQKSAAHRSIAR